jgi:transporter family protein
VNIVIFPITAAFFFALTFFFRKQAGISISPITAYLIESIIQLSIVLLIFFFFNSNTKEIIDFKNKGLIFAGIAGLTITGGVLLNYFALRTDSLSKVVAITSPAQIIFGVAIALIFLGDSLTLRQMLGTILGTIGIVLVIYK